MSGKSIPLVEREAVVRLWFQRQGLTHPRGTRKLSKRFLTRHLEQTGALQLDSINVVDRAHYLTLWSRCGPYERERLDRMIYAERVGYEYWGHEASILPLSHLPIGRRRMARFPPASWRAAPWWSTFDSSTSSRRRVLRRLRLEGPLESTEFERRPHEKGSGTHPGWSPTLPKEDKRSLTFMWHAGKTAVHARRHFRRVYDLAERVYPEGGIASSAEYEDSWLFTGLSGNGIAGERHLEGYFTAPKLKAPERRRVIARHLERGNIVEVRVRDMTEPCYALPEHLAGLESIPEPRGTTLLSPFDSFLWQRRRAEELLDFRYRIEVYVPEKKRRFGYYALPILHDGRLVGRLDPKLHRDRELLEIKKIELEPGIEQGRDMRSDLREGLRGALSDLANFLGATAFSVRRIGRCRAAGIVSYRKPGRGMQVPWAP